MQKEINQFISRLDGKIQDRELQIVKTQLIIFLKDFDLVKRKTELVPLTDPISNELKEYLIAKKLEGLTPASIKHYFNILKNFMLYMNKPVKDITTSDIQLYLYEIERQRAIQGISLQNIQIIIKTFFKWLFINEYIQKDPCARISTMKVERKKRKPLTDIEMEKLRRACRTTREMAIVEVLYSTGCRATELTNLKMEDINFETREVHLFGKGRKHRTSYLSARALITLNDYLQERGFESESIFCSGRKPHQTLSTRSIEKIVKELGELAGIAGRVFPHRIRHTTATDALDKGMELEEVKSLLGHESIGTTLIYTEIHQENVKRNHHKCII